MRILHLTSAAVAAAVLAAPAAWGQKADAFDFYAANLNVLTTREVQNEMGVSAAQRAKLNKHADWFNAESQKLKKLAPGAKTDAQKKALGDRMNSLLSQLKTRAMGELTAAQVRRLREISLQLGGPAVILDDQVARKVGIGSDQLKKLRESFKASVQQTTKLEENTMRPIMVKYEKMQPKTDAEKKALSQKMSAELKTAGDRIKPQVAAIYAKAKKNLEGSLSPVQRKALTSLLGRPFVPKPVK